jgi:hypothetical protein
MLLLAADENLNDKLVRGVQRMSWQLDIVRVQDAGLRGPTTRWCSVGGR